MEIHNQNWSDAELIEVLNDPRHSAEGIRYLYRAHLQSLSNYVMHNNGSLADAEDIFQEVIISFVHLVKEGRFRNESSIKTLLYSMMRNHWLNELKRRGRALKREKYFEEQKIGATNSPVTYGIEHREASKQLLCVVESLGNDCKKILLLFYYENKSMKEILETTHFENEQVVRNKKYKCLKKLEEMISTQKNLYQQLKSFFHG